MVRLSSRNLDRRATDWNLMTLIGFLVFESFVVLLAATQPCEPSRQPLTPSVAQTTPPGPHSTNTPG